MHVVSFKHRIVCEQSAVTDRFSFTSMLLQVRLFEAHKGSDGEDEGGVTGVREGQGDPEDEAIEDNACAPHRQDGYKGGVKSRVVFSVLYHSHLGMHSGLGGGGASQDMGSSNDSQSSEQQAGPAAREVNMLLYNSHYYPILHPTRLFWDSGINHSRYLCTRCLKTCWTAQQLEAHQKLCGMFPAAAVQMPTQDQRMLGFTRLELCLRCPIVVYADFETLNKPVPQQAAAATQLSQHSQLASQFTQPSQVTESGASQQRQQGTPGQPTGGSTRALNSLPAAAYGMEIVSVVQLPGTIPLPDGRYHRHLSYTGPGAAAHLLRRLQRLAWDVNEHVYDKLDLPMTPLTVEQEAAFQAATHCIYCNRPLQQADAETEAAAAGGVDGAAEHAVAGAGSGTGGTDPGGGSGSGAGDGEQESAETGGEGGKGGSGAAAAPAKQGTGPRVRDHCHLTGRYRGAAHSSCNLIAGKQEASATHRAIPVVFHNLSRFDGHLVLQGLAALPANTFQKTQVIADTNETYKSFRLDGLRFIDSAQLLVGSLDDQLAILPDDDKHLLRAPRSRMRPSSCCAARASSPTSTSPPSPGCRIRSCRPQISGTPDSAARRGSQSRSGSTRRPCGNTLAAARWGSTCSCTWRSMCGDWGRRSGAGAMGSSGWIPSGSCPCRPWPGRRHFVSRACSWSCSRIKTNTCLWRRASVVVTP